MTPQTSKIIEETLSGYLDENGNGCGCGGCLREMLEKSLSLQNQKLQKIKGELKASFKDFGLTIGKSHVFNTIDKIFKENE
jgi:hypothetical protein